MSRTTLAVAVVYAAVTIAITWPVVLHLGDGVPADLGDPLLSVWTLWWNARVVPFTDAWWDGPIFYPARDTLALSDHRVGLGIVATPLIWAGASPLVAYNVLFLLSYFLSAISAYALCLAVARHRLAAFIGGLAFGFHPFRAEHLSHLELLSSYWLPVMLLALHRSLETGRTAWLVLLSVALTLQALTCGYYYFFALVLVAGWLLWFRPRVGLPAAYARLAVALAAPLAAMAPVLAHYRRAHDAMGLSRSITDIEAFSADLTGLMTTPDALKIWSTPREWYSPEGGLFPGVTAVVVVLLAIWRFQASSPDRWRLLRRAAAALALVAAAIAIVPSIAGPQDLVVFGLPISITQAYKPLSIAALLATIAALSSPRITAAWRAQSPIAFYALATIAMWVFALGPTARVFGHRVIYKAPYAWLMELPGFSDAFRAPARFAMLAALTLSVAAALACVRLLRGRHPRGARALTVLVAAGILIDGWTAPVRVIAPPPALSVPAGVAADAVIAELPFGVFEDAAAMYRAIAHGHPVVNGLSGYFPPSYTALRAALERGEVEAVSALATDRPVALFVSRKAPPATSTAAILSRTGGMLIASTPTHDVIQLPPQCGIRTAAPLP